MQIRFVDIDGLRTRYLIAGEGRVGEAPALLLVHGIGLSLECWLRNIEPLARGRTVVAVDLLGHGFTDSAAFGETASQRVNARHLARLAAHLGLEQYCVAGSSYGGLVAALMHFEQPQRVTSLALIGTASTFQSEADQEKALRAAAQNAQQALGNPTLESCRKRIEGIVHDPDCVPEALLWPQLTAYALPDRLAAYRATIQSCIDRLGDRDSRAQWRLEKIACPAWVVTGRNDIRADWRAAEAAAARMPRASAEVYDACGHLPFLEHPERFNAGLEAFLQAHRP